MAINVYEQKDFTGGLNLRSDQFQLADNESPEMLNVEVDPRGGVFSRGGMKRIHSTNVAGTWNPYKLYAFYGANNKLMLANGADVRVWGSTGATFDSLQFSAGNNIVADSVHGACFASWGSTLYIATGVGGSSVATYKWDGVTTYASALGGIVLNSDWGSAGKIPRSEHLVSHNSKLFAANTFEEGVAYPNRIRWSNESDPEKWTKNDYIDIQGGGLGITAAVVVNGVLVIFKPYAIYALYGYSSSDFRLIEVSTSIGCHSHNCMTATESGVFFFVRGKGLFYFDGSNLADLFEPIRPAYDLDYINPALDDDVSVFYCGRRIWISLPYSTGTPAGFLNVNLVYDPSIKSYTMFSSADGRGVVGGCDFRTTNGTEIRVACHATSPVVLELDVYDDAFDTITDVSTFSGFSTVYRTKWFDAGSYVQRKMFRRPDLVVREPEVEQNITVSVYHDYQEAIGSERRVFNLLLPTVVGGLVWDTTDWANEYADGSATGSVWSAGAVSGMVKTAKNLGLARCVQLRFTGQLSQPWGINSIGYKWQPRRVKG